MEQNQNHSSGMALPLHMAAVGKETLAEVLDPIKPMRVFPITCDGARISSLIVPFHLDAYCKSHVSA